MFWARTPDTPLTGEGRGVDRGEGREGRDVRV